VTDPEAPTLPPHITVEQARNFVASMMRGDSATPQMIKAAFKEVFTG
jgi:pyruvate dehydrogenase (quinone)